MTASEEGLVRRLLEVAAAVALAAGRADGELAEGDFLALELIRNQGGFASSRQIAERLGALAPATSRRLDRLEKGGLVSRRQNQKDGRLVDVSLTDLGKEVLECQSRSRLACVGPMAGRLDAQKQDALRALLGEILKEGNQNNGNGNGDGG